MFSECFTFFGCKVNSLVNTLIVFVIFASFYDNTHKPLDCFIDGNRVRKIGIFSFSKKYEFSHSQFIHLESLMRLMLLDWEVSNIRYPNSPP